MGRAHKRGDFCRRHSNFNGVMGLAEPTLGLPAPELSSLLALVWHRSDPKTHESRVTLRILSPATTVVIPSRLVRLTLYIIDAGGQLNILIRWSLSFSPFARRTPVEILAPAVMAENTGLTEVFRGDDPTVEYVSTISKLYSYMD